jgi:tripartite-type tricarboxylate transporter receptor subunit TctC
MGSGEDHVSGRGLRRRSVLGALGLAGGLSRVGRVMAQEGAVAWPSRQLRLVIPFAPGGAADGSARSLADLLSRRLNQTVVAENRSGAGGTLAALAVATAPADGYTLFYGTPGQLTTLPILMRDIPYDADRDFQPVSLISRTAYAIAVHPAVPAQTLAELIALAKAQPGRLAYATAGVGSGPHLSGELLNSMAGTSLTHVPYRGSGPALSDVMGRQVPVSFDNFGSLLPLIQRGSLRGIAITSARRSSLLPELPSVGEILPGYDVTAFGFIALRSGTPRPIVDRLNAEIQAVLRDSAFLARTAPFGAVVEGSTPEETQRILRAESVKWREVITRAGIQLEAGP